MKRFLMLAAILAYCAGAGAITLANNGQSDYVIVLGDDAIAAEQTAAAELQAHLTAMTGITLPIVAEKDAAPSAQQIVLGPCARFRAAFPDFDMASLRFDGIVLKTAGDTVYLAGDRPRGTLYAVYAFLEDVLGCRWWTATESFIPSKPVLEISALDTAYTPKLRCREAFYRGAFDGVFAPRLKCNGHFEQIPEERGGHYAILGWCHTAYQLLPPEKYFAEHPDWYSEIDGKRVHENAQLCLTNDAMRAELVKNALEWLRRDPNAGIISISQNDCGGRCQCARCAAVEQEEGAPSGLLVRFVNSVAEEIGREFPDVLVETLAYQYTRPAPKLARPRDNVIIRLCTIECSFSQPLRDGPQNADFARDIAAWSAIAPKLYIWDYVTNFSHYLMPHPNLRVLAPNIRFFVDNKTIGLFEQGDSGSTCGDFVAMRAWVLAHLMWDPTRDPQSLITEFLDGYYGPAAAPLQAYITLMHDAVERSGEPLRCFMTDMPWVTLEDMNRSVEIFDTAQQQVAADPVIAARVLRARLPLDYAWLMHYQQLKRTAMAQKKPFLGPADSRAACEAFIVAANQFNVGQCAEGRPFSDYEATLRDRFRPRGAAPKLCEAMDSNDWADVQDNEFSLFQRGVLSDIVDDPKASDGKAARMPGNHTQWAVQFNVTGDIAGFGSVHAYASIRCDAAAKTGVACQAGIYDTEAKAAVAQKAMPLEELAGGDYQLCDLGVHDLKPGMYVWVAPVNTPDAVQAVLVDRIFFIPEKN